MRKKYIRFMIIFAVLFQILIPDCINVYAEVNNSTKQPEVCAWPSKTMSMYFDFQREVKEALLWSTASEKRLSVSAWDGWLFTRWDLKLPSSALDYVAKWVLWRASSIISTTSTSITLLLLSSKSSVKSKIELFWILFMDRPIVRDYKQLLDIETELFNTAYSFSKRIDLRREFNGDSLNKLSEVIQKYQKLWLLRKGVDVKQGDTMSDVFSDLAAMNAAMKYFLSQWWEEWTSSLRDYYGCLWQSLWDGCRSNFVLWFNYDAINQLEEDYKYTRKYGECNSYASNLSNTMFKSANNNEESVKSAVDDMERAIINLKNALLDWWMWELPDDPCDLSEYELAQLQAFLWPDFNCQDRDVYLQLKEYVNNKKIQNQQRRNITNLLKHAAKVKTSSLDVVWNLWTSITTSDKEVLWFRYYSWESRYNPEFSLTMNTEFNWIFEDVMNSFDQSENAAMELDISYELVKFKWLVDQIDAVMKSADELEKHLQDIADYQCSN